ncbi:hypothetical protein, variant [Puccinia striiformis f. sp. tritici PST-78]|uniref:DASH complex subunit DAD4 n=1 Tax=Puccinia striiformis f. sp. tritici PST-78 TaxID=1165861 RepID=A0A0L0VUP2_9BASI|nr:hypothetical protein, variant [Puccinia striiformis f. sp. tritici PST-78]
MQNPFEEQQTALLSRILGNVEKLSEAMTELILMLETSDLNQAVQNYAVNVKYNLKNEKQENSNQATGDHNPTHGIDPAI